MGPQANIAYHDYTSTPSSSSPFHYKPQLPWIPDTGATHHMTSDAQNLHNVTEYKGIDQIQVGNGQGLHIANQSNAFFPSLHSPLHLKNILHVPSLTKPILSVKRLTTDNSCFFEFWPTYFLVKDQKIRVILLQGPSEEGLYHL